MQGDIIVEEVPPAERPRWGRINAPGLGATVDEDKVAEAHANYLEVGAIAINE
ncbi:MAG: hypothetical protein GY798_05705, partial [Hyphomicrobiales bacterium]|nr:hypothetical protein [Hyphomicrobiales bacterium]